MRMRFIFTSLLTSFFLLACSSGPSPPPLAVKNQNMQENAARHFQECKITPALEEYREALFLAELRDDREAIAFGLMNLGTVQLALGDFKAAEKQFLQSGKQFNELGDSLAQIQVAINLGNIQVKTGRFDLGIATYHRAMELLNQEKEAPPLFRVVILNGLGTAYKGLGQYQVALDALNQAEILARELSATRELAATLMNKSRFFLEQGEMAAALIHANQALDLDRAMENLQGIGADFTMLGLIAEKQGLKDKAKNHFLRAANVFGFCGLEKNRTFCLTRVQKLEKAEGNVLGNKSASH